uniref:Ribonuclease H-like domain-containing protein n=1 Tax=Tanacetum cinerariifolium TaxID=118510 RepID=A0A6L2P219_TANCI|nr:ribonuclease H-like domain-containing protein [Tanacetum cinerariifolium]
MALGYLYPAGVNMVRSMWLFKHKFHANRNLSRYKGRLVANGSSQQLDVEFDETFSPVVKSTTVRTILSLVVSRKWPIHQIDVKNAFLNEIFIWTETSTSCLVFAVANYATRAGFYHSRCDFSLFIYREGSQVAYLLIYVNDIILTASCPALLQHIIGSLNNEFDMTDLGTPVETVSKLGLEGVPVQDPTLYRSLAGGSIGYTDADWAGFHLHAEYRGVANVVVKTAWVRELHFPLMIVTLVYRDNDVVYMSANPVQHQRTKHIKIDIHFFCDMVTAGHGRVLHVPSCF